MNKKEVDSIILPERKYIFTYSDYLLVTGQIEEYERVKDEDIYFLIEHQTKIDYNMPLRMLEYSVEITRRAMKNMNKCHEEYKYPLIVPIVIYTGNRKWLVPTRYLDEVVNMAEIYIKGIDIEYKVIDINEFEMDELLMKNTNLTRAMALEKCKNPKELFDCFSKIIKSLNTKDELENVREILKYLYEKVEVNDFMKIMRIIEKKEEENMSTIQERVRDWFNEAEANRNEAIARAEEMEAKLNKAEAELKEKEETTRKEAKKEARKETLKEVIKRMLKIQLTYDTIEQLTGASIEEIKEVRDELICQKI